MTPIRPLSATQFTRESAERIARVVRRAETTPTGGVPLSFGRSAAASSRGSKVFRVCTFTGAWPVGSTKNVTFKYQTATPNTVVATNLVVGLSPSTACDVSIAREGTSWFLLHPNLTQLPGYSSSGTQVMAIVSGNLVFVGTTAC